MRNYRLLVYIALAAFWASCGLPGIFDDDSNSRNVGNNPTFAEQVLSVEITGGFAGVDRKLIVYADRRAVYTDNLLGNRKWQTTLDKSAFAAIDVLMRSNHFFDLEDQYIEPRAADAFFYLITYSPDSNVKALLTDNITVPEDVEDIVSGIQELIQDIIAEVPGLSLSLSKSHMQPGDSVAMTLTVRNFSDHAINLHFNDSQIFDFRVTSVISGRTDDELLWNWAHDKGFTQALWNMTLAAGDSESYRMTWRGADNTGQNIAGNFLVFADLVSSPGGTTSGMEFSISD